jgi:5'-nucleotidase
MKKHSMRYTVFSLVFFLLFAINTAVTQEIDDSWPKRVLITNDNGIDDIKIIELARSFSKVAKTYVVAPAEDQSSSTHYTTIFRTGKINVQKRSLGDGIIAYSVDGYPADCVILAGLGLLKDNPPDLVVSGINGGPNLGEAWIGSGTIGAARMAAFAGIPAIAVSGLDDDCSECVAAATEWVVKLAQSEIVHNLESGQYLTISIPRKHPSEIKGVKIVKRAPALGMPLLEKLPPASEKSDIETWVLKPPTELIPPPVDSDVAVWKSNYIAIVPMRADEHDYELLNKLINKTKDLPAWPPSYRKSN